MTKHTVFSSDGWSLNFPTSEEYAQFNAEKNILIKKWHKKLQDKYGFWASNQNKYVPRIEDLNSLDRRFV